MRLNQPFTHRRDAFSLVELLIVIGFIAVLAALTASATFKIIGVQEEKTTQNNLMKLYALLDQRWKAVIAKANSEPLTKNAIEMAGYQMGVPLPNDPQVVRRARAIHVKLSLQQHFPVRLIEVKAPLNDYPVPSVFAETVNPTTVLTVENMSSALLYLALKQAGSGVSTEADAILNSMEMLPVFRIDGSVIPDMKIIADSWGTPLVFSRYPTADPELNPNGAELAPPWRDPQDPNGTLSESIWVKPPPPSNVPYWNFVQRAHETGVQRSYKLLPVIMSAGPDKLHGLDTSTGMAPPSNGSKTFASLAVANPAQTNDNIYTYRLRQGGSGN